MRRRLLALLTAPLLGGAVLIAGATPAQAACPTAGSETTRAYWGPTASWVQVTTYYVDCGAYKRLQGWRYDDETNVRRSYGSQTYGGNPTTKWFSSGQAGAVNAINGFPEWFDNHYIQLGGQSCYDPCTVAMWGRADMTLALDDDFIVSEQL